MLIYIWLDNIQLDIFYRLVSFLWKNVSSKWFLWFECTVNIYPYLFYIVCQCLITSGSILCRTLVQPHIVDYLVLICTTDIILRCIMLFYFGFTFKCYVLFLQSENNFMTLQSFNKIDQLYKCWLRKKLSQPSFPFRNG